MRRVFVDIGGFNGSSALAALDPIFAFDIVYCFEPVPFLAKEIRNRIPSKRLVILEKALSDCDGVQTLHNAGSLAGSLFSDAPPYGTSMGCISVETIDAAAFFMSSIAEDDFVRVKFNCEGAEFQIVESLQRSGMLRMLEGSLIDFDSEKIESLAGKADYCRSVLRSGSIRFYEPPEVQYGMVTNYGGVRNWLLESGSAVPGLMRAVASIAYNLQMFLDAEVNGYHKLKIKKAVGLAR